MIKARIFFRIMAIIIVSHEITKAIDIQIDYDLEKEIFFPEDYPSQTELYEEINLVTNMNESNTDYLPNNALLLMGFGIMVGVLAIVYLIKKYIFRFCTTSGDHEPPIDSRQENPCIIIYPDQPNEILQIA